MSPPVLVLADDLSGAAECAAVLADPGAPSAIRLAPATPAPNGLTVVDLHCRAASAGDAAARTNAALAAAPPGGLLFLKIDSLLRGNVAATVDALAARTPVVVATALPAGERTVRGGVVHLGGVPLHRTGAHRLEPEPAPPGVPAALGRPDCPVVGTAELHDDPEGALRSALGRAPVVVCDAETDSDLDRIAAATVALGAALAGSGGFAAALGRATGRAGLGPGPAPEAPARPVLAVVGSAEPVAERQVGMLLADGAAEVRPDSGGGVRLVHEGAHTPAGAGVTVLRPDPAVRGDPAAIAGSLTAAAVTLAGGPDGPHLLLTGGETARRVLDALGVDRLDPLGQVDHGAVRSRTASGRQVVTRPGSFGDETSLREMAAAVATPTVHSARHDRKAAV